MEIIQERLEREYNLDILMTAPSVEYLVTRTNGEQVYVSRQHRPAVPGQDTVAVKLRKGRNRLLLKVANGEGPHGFYLTILSQQELQPVEEAVK